MERGLKPFFQGPENSSSLFPVFHSASASCVHCGWGQEVPATTKDCSCAIPGLIQNKTRWKFWKNICSHQASSPSLPDPQAVGNSVEKQGNISIRRCSNFGSVCCSLLCTQKVSPLCTQAAQFRAFRESKKELLSQTHFSPRNINTKETFIIFENACTDFN